MKILKTILVFVVCMLLYFIPALLFKSDPAFYKALPKPAYAPPAVLFGIAWPILYALFSLYLAIHIVNKSLSKELLIYFVINYIISFFFNKVFFIDKNLFLSFAVTFCSFITGLFIFITTFKKSKKEFLWFLPYLLWTLYATVLMVHIYLIN
ncbi:MAG: tryptophan-rich sensory protein [Anaeroplasmataceae bacterium]|nr:tryptophan-rich sensory protein [Anaeroplasmataceae bacterium]